MLNWKVEIAFWDPVEGFGKEVEDERYCGKAKRWTSFFIIDVSPLES